jgi:hypothetical protein
MTDNEMEVAEEDFIDAMKGVSSMNSQDLRAPYIKLAHILDISAPSGNAPANNPRVSHGTDIKHVSQTLSLSRNSAKWMEDTPRNFQLALQVGFITYVCNITYTG